MNPAIKIPLYPSGPDDILTPGFYRRKSRFYNHTLRIRISKANIIYSRLFGDKAASWTDAHCRKTAERKVN